MNISLYRDKRRRTTWQLSIRVVGTLLGIGVVWLVAQAIVSKKADTLPLGAPSTVYNALLPKKVLVDKVVELRTTIESYEAELATARLEHDENVKLKAELGRTPRPVGVLGHVRTLPNRSFYDTFMIDAGTDEHISIGQTAYAFDTIALGSVSEVTSDTATITLFSAANRDTSGTVMGSDIAVTLIGRGGGEYEVRMPRDVPFEVGGIIAQQSTHSAVLAEIERIATDPRDPFQKLYAKAPVNLQALKWVIVR